MVIYHIDMVILDIDMGDDVRLMIWEMTGSIRSSPISIWDILSACLAVVQMHEPAHLARHVEEPHRVTRYDLVILSG
jgi:hypothetical protein